MKPISLKSLRWLLPGFALLPVAICSAQDFTGLTSGQNSKLADLLRQSDAPLQQPEAPQIRVSDFASSAYWKGVMALGRSISDPELEKLFVVENPSSELAIAMSAAHCFRDEHELTRMLLYYTVLVRDSPRTRRERPLQPGDLTQRHRPLWEAILLSPELRGVDGGTIEPRKCSEALAAIGDPRSMPVINRARERLTVGQIKRGYWANPSKDDLVTYAENASSDWIMPLATIGKGTPEGLEALLAAVQLCETEHPKILSLKSLGLDLHPTQRGVADQVTEVVFVKKAFDGNWLWKNSIDKLPEKERTPAVTEVLRIARENFAKTE
jgi:hypothetical protein